MTVACLFVTCLIMSNILAVKLTEVDGRVLDAGNVVFPISLHHRRRADRGVGVPGGAARDLDRIRHATCWPRWRSRRRSTCRPPVSGSDQKAYEDILGFSARLLLASFCAFLVGEFTNSAIMAKMKVATEGRWLWSRTISSTLVAEALDSTIFVTIAFAGTGAPLMNTITTNWVLKSGYEIIATPLTYLAVGYLKRAEGVDVYDRDTRLVPIEL